MPILYDNHTGMVKGIADEGMPQFRHSDVKGNLYVQFDVEFPGDNFLQEEDIKVSNV